jgi:two-component system, NarL family, nitrate/nitrite response regulator NarL
MRPKIRILIADEQVMVREALSMVLQAQPDLLVVGQAGNGEEAVAQAERLRPDILLLDLELPRLSGMNVLRRVLKGPARTHVIVLEDGTPADQMIAALRLGTLGFIPKHSTPELLFKGIRAVAEGGYWVGHENMRAMLESLRAMPAAQADEARSRCRELTKAEQRVANAVASGLTNKEVAKECSISEQTVKHHLTRIFGKVGVSNRLELALFARQNFEIRD